MQKWLCFALFAFAGWWLASSPTTEAVALPDGSLAYPGYSFTNSEPYALEARVLSREDYRFGREAELSPTDLALGWGRMAEDEIASRFEISQRNRWYYWRTDQFPIPKAEVQAQSANVHIIPANEAVADELARIDAHDLVRLRGQLVDVRADDGWRWNSSRSRTDTGNGACELMLLEEIAWL
jgi:hypothetical protein